MSKRGPTSELNHDNWDQEDEDKETPGEFKQASNDVIQNRRILSAKRKTPGGNGENSPKTPFSGFKGFTGGGGSSTPSKPNFSFITSVAEAGSSSAANNKVNGQDRSSKDEKKLSADEYYHQLKSLNVSVSAWIAKHVQSNPYCILTPVFRDYEKHLSNIEKKKPQLSSDSENTDSPSANETSIKGDLKADKLEDKKEESSKTDESITEARLAVSSSSDKEKSAEEPVKEANEEKTTSEETPATTSQSIFGSIGTASTFSFGTAKPSTTPAATPGSFVFGNTNSSATSLFGSNPFGAASTPGAQCSFGSIANKTPGATTGFSFGNTGPAFSFANAAKKPDNAEGENTEEVDESEEPPKVEFNTFKEDDSIYDIKCKMFVLKDKEYKERGLGQLFIKKKDSESKAQLLVRSSGATGQILMNVLLSSSLAPKRIGKNNVQMACVASPADKEPSIVMIRVKTGEDADELLEKIEEYKK